MCPVCEPRSGPSRGHVQFTGRWMERAGLKVQSVDPKWLQEHECLRSTISLGAKGHKNGAGVISLVGFINWRNKHSQSWCRAPVSDQVNPVSWWDVRWGTTPESDHNHTFVHSFTEKITLITESPSFPSHKRFLTWTSISEPSFSFIRATHTCSIFMYSSSMNKFGSLESARPGAHGVKSQNSI